MQRSTPPALASRARACLHGLGAAVSLWLALILASTAIAQTSAAQRWDRASAGDLLAYIETLGSHGLDPEDYAPGALRAALEAGDAGTIEERASRSFALAARDLATGHLHGAERGRYFIASDPFDAGQAADLIDRALAAHDVAGTLEALAPRTRQYAELKAELAALAPGNLRERRMLETNLERWRWLPRDLGPRYLMVNIAEYRARLVDNGRIVATHKVIVGKRSTPTPRFSTQVTGVIFNPTWTVPQSIIRESVGSLVRRSPSVARARGYTWSWDGGHLRVVQQPGPQNALGQFKLDMPNPFTVYMHDTPTKELFERDVRTLSHGCIRTQDPFALAALLLDGTGWTPAKIAETVASRATTRVALDRPIPAFVAYFTAVADDEGTVSYLEDPYGLDGPIAARLSYGSVDASMPRLAAATSECSAA